MRITKIFAQGWWPIKGAILALRRLKGLSVLGFTAQLLKKVVIRRVSGGRFETFKAGIRMANQDKSANAFLSGEREGISHPFRIGSRSLDELCARTFLCV